MSQVHRIAMWSGPRNISTALMRSWGSRPDTIVCDEPFYAYYLKTTGYTHHPGYQEVLSTQESDWQQVVDQLTGSLPDNNQILYQKQMAHHLVGDYSLSWADEMINMFLIRDPREMLLSLIQKIPEPTIEETGLPQQVALFERIRNQKGIIPAVIDAKDVLLDPPGMLKKLCASIAVPFREEMLRWKPGIHETDGVWAKFWYANVAESTTFSPYSPRTGEIPSKHKRLLQQCQALYNSLSNHKLSIT
ncbi:MAG: hypothetical protein RH917_15705 [Lacipirellulaceae bacterium]